MKDYLLNLKGKDFYLKPYPIIKKKRKSILKDIK
jgi:hypothetical protein